MLPLGATCTRMTCPHFVPFGPFIDAGSVGQCGASRYGFGRLGFCPGLVGASCALALESAARATSIKARRWRANIRYLRECETVAANNAEDCRASKGLVHLSNASGLQKLKQRQRHPDGLRNLRSWIPTFVGMTKCSV